MQCYHALGAVHGLYKPVDARFRDFIAIPKANGYQSLHTVLFGPYGSPIEVQIRTEDMDLIAERGIAAHWMYKTGGLAAAAPRRARTTGCRPAREQQAPARRWSSWRTSRSTCSRTRSTCSPRKGDILSLPRNATALDFAYAVHTDVGNHAVAARVDKKLVPLRTGWPAARRSRSSPRRRPTPKPQWLEFVVSGKARTAIRHHLKRLQHEDAVELGHRMLDRALEALRGLARPAAAERSSIPGRAPLPAAGGPAGRHRAGQPDAAQVAQALAHGRPTPRPGDARRCRRREDPDHRQRARRAQLRQLLPPDSRRRDHGLPVRRQGRRGAPAGLPNVPEYRKSPSAGCRSAGTARSGDFRAALRVEVENKPGVLAQVAASVAEAESNIDGVEYLERDANIAVMHFAIEVSAPQAPGRRDPPVRRLDVVHGVQRL
jgi:GTP diphosphokinase / guanosine-3',5'-bis(diphosphate) 3'-diphosphatase